MSKSIWKRDLIPPPLKPYVWSAVTILFIVGTFMEWSDVFSARPSLSPAITLSDLK